MKELGEEMNNIYGGSRKGGEKKETGRKIKVKKIEGESKSMSLCGGSSFLDTSNCVCQSRLLAADRSLEEVEEGGAAAGGG